ncbi:MAG: hypothetical protein CMB18_02555 [Euryarchaeota archaeon]|nr:hypothetical protein [Euryarchaeota archaeon]
MSKTRISHLSQVGRITPTWIKAKNATISIIAQKKPVNNPLARDFLPLTKLTMIPKIRRRMLPQKTVESVSESIPPSIPNAIEEIKIKNGDVPNPVPITNSVRFFIDCLFTEAESSSMFGRFESSSIFLPLMVMLCKSMLFIEVYDLF